MQFVYFRLHTVMDSDKILVMEGGSLIEYDHPYILLQKEGGFLRNLVEITGKLTSKNLESIAKEVSILLLHTCFINSITS